jgi:hypothetical protein
MLNKLRRKIERLTKRGNLILKLFTAFAIISLMAVLITEYYWGINLPIIILNVGIGVVYVILLVKNATNQSRFMASAVVVLCSIGSVIYIYDDQKNFIPPVIIDSDVEKEYSIKGFVIDSVKKKKLPFQILTLSGPLFKDTLYTNSSSNGYYKINRTLSDSAARLPISLQVKANGYEDWEITKPFNSLAKLDAFTIALKAKLTTIAPDLPEIPRLIDYSIKIRSTMAVLGKPIPLGKLQVIYNSKLVAKISGSYFELKRRLTQSEALKKLKLMVSAEGYKNKEISIKPIEFVDNKIALFNLTPEEKVVEIPSSSFQIEVIYGGNAKDYDKVMKIIKEEGCKIINVINEDSFSTPEIMYFTSDAEAERIAANLAKKLGRDLKVGQYPPKAGYSKIIRLLYK